MVSYGGSKTFYLSKSVQGKSCKIKIGRFPDLSIMEARELADELKTQISLGVNPITEKSKLLNEMTFRALFYKYNAYYSRYSIKTWKEDAVKIKKNTKNLYDKGIPSITSDDIQEIFDGLPLTYTSNMFLYKLRIRLTLSNL
jgi:hypothetical protein